MVIGIGLNVEPFDADAPDTGFATLQELDAGIDAPTALARVALPLARALQRFEQAGFAAFADAFAARDVLQGRAVRTSGPEPAEGIARGVSARGGLLIDTHTGRIDVGSGEVSVRLNAEAPC